MSPLEVVTLSAAVIGILFGGVGLLVSVLTYRRDRPSLRISASQSLNDTHSGWQFAITVENHTRHPERIADIGVESDSGDRISLLRKMLLKGGSGAEFSLIEPLPVPAFDSYTYIRPLAEQHALWLKNGLQKATLLYVRTTWGKEFSADLPRHLGRLLEVGHLPE